MLIVRMLNLNIEYSLPRAKLRLEEARNQLKIPDKIKIAKRQEVQKRLQSVNNQSSQVGDSRPLSYIQFSPNSKLLATASWYLLVFITLIFFTLLVFRFLS